MKDQPVLKTPPSSVSIKAGPILILPKDDFLRLDDRHRRRAITVTGVANVEALGEVFDLVMASADQGIGWFLEQLPVLYGRHGLQPTTETHARRIYYTTLRQIRADLTYREVVENPSGLRLTPYLQWVATPGTDCVAEFEDSHALMDGRVFSVEHPIWRTWWPPAGHESDCRVRILPSRRARRMRLTGQEPTGAGLREARRLGQRLIITRP